MAATGDLTRRIRARRRRAVGGRGRAAARDHLQHDDRLDRALPARGGAARAAVVARPAVDRRRARDPQPADDHQDGAARPARARPWPPETLRTAVADIDEEIARLNRIVSEVLDFARPIKFDLAPADLNALCDDAAQGGERGYRRCAVTRDLDRSLRPVMHRRRAAAAGAGQHPDERPARGHGAGRTPPPPDPIRLKTLRLGADRVADRGPRSRHRHCCQKICRASSIRTSRRAGPAPASASRSRGTSSKGWAARSPSSSRKGEGTDVRIELPDADRRVRSDSRSRIEHAGASSER